MYRILITVFMLIFNLPGYAEKTMLFPHACQKGESVSIALMGDLLLHRPLQEKGLRNGFDSLWQSALPIIQSVDIAYANLEGSIGKNNAVGSGFPLFSYPTGLAAALKGNGFSIVSTANNHALDQGSHGINRTILTLQAANLPFVGTRLRDGSSQSSWVYIMKKKHMTIAWIACTEHTNGIPDTYQQIPYCFKNTDKQWILDTVQRLKPSVDMIIITPHWGEEYSDRPTSRQVQWAHLVLEAGATVVAGSHPHVLQPAEQYITRDGRATFIIYSLGNFVSFQGSLKMRTTVILLLNFTKTSKGTIITGMRFVPFYMENRSGLEQLRLIRLPVTNKTSPAYQIILRLLPIGNVLYPTTWSGDWNCQSQ